jgi:N6-adenosine-specific RNA methylase IME4
MNITSCPRFQHDRFSVVYADPPFPFATWSALGTGRGAIAHYDTMSIEQIKGYRVKGVPVADIVAENAVVFLWTPGPQTPRVAEIMQAWGFRFSGIAFVWVKPTRGLNRLLKDAVAGVSIIKPKDCGPLSFVAGGGYSTRKNAEFCWLGIRGKLGCQDHSIRDVVCAPRGQHSEKPDEIRDRITRMFPRGPRIELFVRKTASGWISDGDQIGLLDNGPVRTRRQPSNLTGRHQNSPNSPTDAASD